MDEIVAFLNRMLDEDELWALAASASYHGDEPYTVPGGVHWTWAVGENWEPIEVDPMMSYVGEDRYDDRSPSLITAEKFPMSFGEPLEGRVLGDMGEVRTGDAGHIVRQDPARTLRRIAADRAIIAMHSPHRHGACPVCWRITPRSSIREDYPCPTLRALAQRYADHPDFQAEWRS